MIGKVATEVATTNFQAGFGIEYRASTIVTLSLPPFCSARSEVGNGSSTVNNGFPALVAGSTAGDFRLVFQDDRNGSTNAWNTWYRKTSNGGATWTAALRISDLGSGAPYKTASGYNFPYGDYLELAVDSAGQNHIIWGEGLSYTGPGGTWYTRGQ